MQKNNSIGFIHLRYFPASYVQFEYVMMAEVGECNGAGTGGVGGGGGDSHDEDKHIQKHIVCPCHMYKCHFNSA